MKLNVMITIDSEGQLKPLDLMYDELVTKGFYFVGKPNHVKRNIKNLNIQHKTPKAEGKMPVRYTKNNDFVVITIGIYDNNFGGYSMQLILTDECIESEVNETQHHIVEHFKQALPIGLKLLRVITLADMIDSNLTGLSNKVTNITT